MYDRPRSDRGIDRREGGGILTRAVRRCFPFLASLLLVAALGTAQPATGQGPDARPLPTFSTAQAERVLTVDGSGSAGTADTTEALDTTTGWVGLADTVNDAGFGCSGVRPCGDPADPWLAVGPNHVVQTVRAAMRITNRAGSVLSTVSLATFFGVPAGQVRWDDARVVYDQARSRWVATQFSFDCGSGYLYLALSNGADPTGTWSTFVKEFPGEIPRYPGLGGSSDKIVLGTNQYAIASSGSSCGAGDFLGARLHVVDWADALTPGDGAAFHSSDPDPDFFTWRPAAMPNAPSSATAAHLVVVDTFSGFADVGYATITGTGAAGTIGFGVYRNLTDEGLIGEFANPIAPRQPGTPSTIVNAVDLRPTDAVWQNGRLWFVSTYPCFLDTVRDCIRTTELDTTATGAATVRQDFTIGQWGYDSYMGGVGLAGNGNVFVAYTRSSAVSFPSTMVAYRRGSDPVNVIRATHLIRTGSGTYKGTGWGDHVGVAQDPSNAAAVWHGQAHADASGGWATWIGRLALATIGTSGTVGRLSGSDRYATAAEITKATYAPNVPVVYIATGANFPDALAGAPPAALEDSPLLLVTKDSIPSPIASELARLKPARIVVLGSAGVISDAVRGQLVGYTASKSSAAVTRLAGSDRYATAAEITRATYAPGVPVVYVATGANFPDALAGGPAAALEDSPLLLVTKDSIPPVIAAELARLKPARIVVLGSAGVVSEAVRNQLVGYTVSNSSASVTRLAGSDRYSTAAAITKAAFAPGVPVVYIATGVNFPDALAGAPPAALEDGPLLLVMKDSIPAVIAEELARPKPGRIVVLGSAGVVSDAVKSQLASYVVAP